MLEEKPIDTTMFRRGLVEIPKPLPIQAPIPLPTPIPIPQPMAMPRPAALPGTATIDQYHLPPPETPSIVAGQASRLTREGTPAVGQYLAPAQMQGAGIPGSPTQSSAAASAQVEATRRALTTPLTPPPSVATSQINLPRPNRFWRGTAARRRVTMPTPEAIWQGVPTTSQIALPTPEDYWRR